MSIQGKESPDFRLRFRPDHSVTVIGRHGTFERQGRFKVNHRAIERSFSAHFGPGLADLVDLGLSVYTADRLCRRRQGRGGRYAHRWHRTLALEIPLRRPEVWRDPELAMRLRELLAFMTEDDWEFRFVQRGGPRREVQAYLFDTIPARPITVALFSGGLDSFAGLCVEAEEKRSDAFVLVSGWTNARLASRQDRLFRALEGRIGRMLVPIQIPFGIRHEGHAYNDNERSQRTRGFVHSVLGAAVALGSGSDSLACYENGVGALNLPMTEAQLGTQHARSAHPVALAQVAELIELATGQPFQIRLPFLFRTKAEMCAGIQREELRKCVAATVSCDSFPLRVKGRTQCGACTSCLLRRQALHAAGFAELDPHDAYQFDVDDHGPSGVPGHFQAMIHQVWRLRRALSASDPWGDLALEFPELEETALELGTRGRDEQETREGIVRLYRQYCGDWDRFEQRTLPISVPA